LLGASFFPEALESLQKRRALLQENKNAAAEDMQQARSPDVPILLLRKGYPSKEKWQMIWPS